MVLGSHNSNEKDSCRPVLENKISEMKENEVKSIFTLAGIEPLKLWRLENCYWPEHPDYLKIRADSPWWLVRTDFGLIKIGWRKRVISINWEDTPVRCRVSGTDQTTMEDYMVHAWSVEDAIRYLHVVGEAARSLAGQDGSAEAVAALILAGVSQMTGYSPFTPNEQRAVADIIRVDRKRWTEAARRLERANNDLAQEQDLIVRAWKTALEKTVAEMADREMKFNRSLEVQRLECERVRKERDEAVAELQKACEQAKAYAQASA